MQAIGIVLAVIGLGLIVLAYMRGREGGTGAAEGPPPPRRAQSLMAFGVGLLLVGAVLALVSDV